MTTKNFKTIIEKKLSDYYKPTPKNFRKLGDALLGIALFTSTTSIAMDNKWVSISSVVIGIIGKFLTNFFTEERIYHSYESTEENTTSNEFK